MADEIKPEAKTSSVILDRTFLYEGEFIGPGRKDGLSADAADFLARRMIELRAEEAAVQQLEDGSLTSIKPTTQVDPVGTGVITPVTTADLDAQIAALQARRAAIGHVTDPAEGAAAPVDIADTLDDAAVAQKLKDAGFDTADKVKSATDDQLKAIPGIGQVTVDKIRAVQG